MAIIEQAPEQAPTFTRNLATVPRVVVFRALRGLGDFLVAVPALRTLRASLPNVRIALVGLRELQPVAMRFNHLYDEFVCFPGWFGIPEAGYAGDTDRLASWYGADAVIQMHGDGTSSNGFCLSLEPKALAAYGPATIDYAGTVDTAPYPLHVREVDRCLDVAVRALGLLGVEAVALDRSLEFWVSSDDMYEAADVLGRWADEPYAVVHPGAQLLDRRWDPECFAEVGRVLAEECRVLVTGVATEKGLAEEVADQIGDSARSIAGELNLGGMAALLAGARGVITNDTGISHLADAVMTRSVVVFCASDPERWAPADRALHAPVFRPARDGERANITPEGRRLVAPDVPAVLRAMADVGIVAQEASCASR